VQLDTETMFKNNKTNVLIHVLGWFVLFSLPYVLTYGQDEIVSRVITRFWLPLAFYAVIFYGNYFFLIDRFLFSKKALQFIVINAIVIVLFILLKEKIENNLFGEFMEKVAKRREGTGPPFKIFFYIQMLSYLAPLLFSIAIKSTRRWVKTEAKRKEADNFRLQSELKHLHYQLQPHFFFNALNNIYALIDVSPEQAKTTIHSLGKLMRYMLYDTNVELVPLSKEIEFMKKYIELMRLRISEKTQINSSFPMEHTETKVAPLLFISLIENAFKHGVSANKESVINIEMTNENNKVNFKIENDNFPKEANDKSGSGIGLQNIKKRLQLLYADKYNLSHSVNNERFTVDLEIETT